MILPLSGFNLTMESSRGFNIMKMGIDRKSLASLDIPKYERTSGTEKWERKLAIEGNI